MRTKLLTTMGFIMLISFMILGFFAIPTGGLICSIIGLVYGIKKKDKLVTRLSVIALILVIVFIIAFCIGLQSM